eukprot:TRINITY_DN745_c0_g1_i1.p3 TRINITY_DN745_c0_g1~~TRINITY_DN745_c0_g1_i1.p3  ORF type:complete len:125 (+),score=20.58 TRINITY_DN745_c0_g1_i1:26-376(+)
MASAGAAVLLLLLMVVVPGVYTDAVAGQESLQSTGSKCVHGVEKDGGCICSPGWTGKACDLPYGTGLGDSYGGVGCAYPDSPDCCNGVCCPCGPFGYSTFALCCPCYYPYTYYCDM